jgi:thiosulfate/3-mercaptopyruvate sulfurtransferase
MTKPENDLLVSVEELSRNLGSPDWVIVDCRFNLARPDAGEAAYRKAHIPGAHYAHLDRDLASRPTAASGRHPLPDPEALRRLFSRWGVTPSTHVVAYDDAGGAIAARLWWLLRWMGHARAALLDGGFPAWQAAGLSLSDEPPVSRPAQFRGSPGHMPTADTDELERRLGDSRLLLLDARARPRYLGREEPIDPVAGHVPGAVNLPFQNSLETDGRFRDADELRSTLEPLLAGRPREEVVAMCGSGVTACHDIFALELAGLSGVRLYPGSWSEWIRSPTRPVARE